MDFPKAFASVPELKGIHLISIPQMLSVQLYRNHIDW